MKQLNRTQSIIMLIGAILMVAGAGLYVFGAETGHKVAPCVFAPGTLMFAAMQAAQRYDGNDITLRRLRRIMLTGGAFFIISAVLMAENAYHVVFPYFLKAGIAQVKIQDHAIRPGDDIQIHGPTTGTRS